MHMHMCMHMCMHMHMCPPHAPYALHARSYATRIRLQALADFNHALSLDEVCCQAYTNRGNCLRKQMLHREAMKDYDRAIQLAPHDAKAFNNRGALALKMSRWEVRHTRPTYPPAHSRSRPLS